MLFPPEAVNFLPPTPKQPGSVCPAGSWRRRRRGAGSEHGSCPVRAKPLLPGPRGSSARPRRAAAGWIPRPSVSERLRMESFWVGVARTPTEGVVVVVVVLGGRGAASQLSTFAHFKLLKRVCPRIPAPDQQPDRRAGSLVPPLPLPCKKQDD